MLIVQFFVKTLLLVKYTMRRKRKDYKKIKKRMKKKVKKIKRRLTVIGFLLTILL